MNKLLFRLTLAFCVCAATSACGDNNSTKLQGQWRCKGEFKEYAGNNTVVYNSDGNPVAWGTFSMSADKLVENTNKIRIYPGTAGMSREQIANSLMLNGRTDAATTLLQNGYFDTAADFKVITKIHHLDQNIFEGEMVSYWKNGKEDPTVSGNGQVWHCDKVK